MMMSMVYIPIFVPGAVRVVTGILALPCTVDFPVISMAYLATDTGFRPSIVPTEDSVVEATTHTTALVNRVIVGGSYLQVPNPCHGSACAYQVDFTAPSLKCSSDISTTYDLSTNVPQTYQYDSWVPVLNGTLATLDSGYALTVATRDGVVRPVPHLNPPVAVRCMAFRAGYHV